MSSSPSSRGPARSSSQRPSTPDQARPSIKRTGSGSIAPKSEYLRSALQARRAQNNTPTPSPLDMRVPPASAPKTQEVKPERTSPDLFAEFALSEEQTAPVSPIRRRRPSDVGPPRSKTSRELTKEIETLKDNLMTSNMRVELLKKRNSELQHNVTELVERVAELEPLEEENQELRDENNYYKLKMQDMEDEMEQLKLENDSLRQSNEEMLAINVECSSHWEDQELAVQEAAETIVALETEKAALAAEVQKLHERVTALEDNNSSTAGTLADGSPRCPSVVYSIDEARPSTSHFDSDYYSQPDSPQNKNSRESVISITPSERSRKFLDLSQERRRSARDLAKRMSVASLKALRIASTSPAPAVPAVPIVYQQQIPRIVEVVANDKRCSKAPKRYRDRTLPKQPLLDALEMSPNTSEAKFGASDLQSLNQKSYDSPLMYRPNRPVSNRSSNDQSDLRTPTTRTRPRSRQPSGTEMSPRVPSRISSKQAHTSNSSETLSSRDYPSHRDSRNPQLRHQSEPDIGVEDTCVEECSAPIPNRGSVASNSDLTSEADPSDKDRWWKSIDRLNQPAAEVSQQPVNQPMASRPVIEFHTIIPQQPPRRSPSKSQAPDARATPTRHVGTGNSALRSSSRDTESLATTPYGERDFLFNGNEDDDTFLRKVKAGRR